MEEFEILQIEKLNAFRCLLLNEVVYSMKLDNGDVIWDNDASLKAIITCILTDFVEKQLDSEFKVFSWIFYAEFKVMKPKKMFYVSEYEMNEVIAVMKYALEEKLKEADDIKLDEKYLSIDETRKFLLENFKEYGPEFLNNIPKNFHDKKNVEKHLCFCALAQKIFQLCVDQLNEKNEKRKNEKIMMRIMCEMKIEDRKEWHLFSDEVLEVIEKLLENEERLESMKDQIEKWRNKWKTDTTFSTITIPLFETILNIVGIPKSRFTLVPDYHFFKNLVELPLKMSYNAMNVISPNGQKAYHQIQAQFLIFQYGACDINWNMDNKKLKNRTKARIIEEMNEVGKGYTSVEEINERVERVKNSKLAQKTPLASFHGVPYHVQLRKEELFEIRRYSRSKLSEKDLIDGIPIWISKYLEMLIVITMFFTEQKDQKLMKNVMRAWTVCLPNIQIEKMEDFEYWINNPNMAQFYDFDSILSVSNQYKINNQSDFFSTEDQLLESHYLFCRSDPLRTSISNRKPTMNTLPNDNLEVIMSVWPEVSLQISDESFERFESLVYKFYEELGKKYDEKQAKHYFLSFGSFKGIYLEKMKEFIDVAYVNGNVMVRKKKVLKIEEPEKEEEVEKVMKRYVNDVKNVESCEKCRDDTQEKTGFLKKIEDFEKKNEENQKVIRRNEEDLMNFKSQINSDKLKYREEIQKHKEDVKNREAKVEKLNQEIKEYREESRIEREQLYENVRETSKMADENVKKMKIELESFKISDDSINKEIDEFMSKNEELKARIDSCEKKYLTSEEALQIAQKRVRILEQHLAQMNSQEVCD